MRRSKGIAIVVLASIAIIVTLTIFLTPTVPSIKKALIIDGLSKDLPDQGFIDQATGILRKAGYSVDVVNNATVVLYEKLPSMGYDLMIFRTHGAAELTYAKSKSTGAVRLIGVSSSLFTSEPFTQDQYPFEQQQNYLKPSKAVYNGKDYFAATSFFLKDRMEGRFKDSIIILMGCNGFPPVKLNESYTESVPSVLIKKGSSAVIGWDGTVSLDRTEKATISLLDKFRSGMKIEDAYKDTNQTLGYEPDTKAKLDILTRDML